ncbi:MAG: ABC transporter substrate-binding protein [Acidimicrobiales bacterium]
MSKQRTYKKAGMKTAAILAAGGLLALGIGSSTSLAATRAHRTSSTRHTSSSPAANLSWFFWVGSPTGVRTWTHVASLVSKSYPRIHVGLTTTSWTDYWQKLPLEASANSLPDLAGLQFGYIGSDGSSFRPLNSLIKQNHYSLAGFTPTMIRELSVNGNLLALPYDFGPVVIAYNKTLFEQKHVPLPKDGWTWSQFLSDAQKLTGGGDYGWLPGQSFLELDYDISGVPDAYLQHGHFSVDNPAFIRGIQQQAELSYKYHVAPTYSTAPNWATTEFASGKVAMEPNGPWGLEPLKAQSNFQVGWVEFPSGPHGEHTYNEGSGFGITKDSKNPQAAFKALTVMLGGQAENYAASVGRAFPARVAADHTWVNYAGEGAGPVMYAALKTAQPMEVTTNWEEFQTAISKYTPLVLSGSISATQFAKDVQRESGSGTGVSPGNLTSLIGG